MPGVDFGNDAASAGGQLGLGMQSNALKAQELNQKAIQDAQELPQKQALQGQSENAASDLSRQESNQEQQRDMVTINPQVAEALGDSKLTGLKMKASMFGALANLKGRADMFRKPVYGTVDGKKTIGRMDYNEAGDLVWIPAKGDEGAPPKPSVTSKVPAGDTSSRWFKHMQDSGRALVAAQGKKGGIPGTGVMSTLKGKMGMGDKGDASKLAGLKQLVQEYRTARDNYNKKAASEGLSPQPSDPVADAAMDALTASINQQDNLQNQPSADSVGSKFGF